MKNDDKPSPSRELGAKVIHAALSILRDNGKEMPLRGLRAKIEETVKLDSWALERHEKSGYARWESFLHFYSIECQKAGYLVKKKGIWYLTPEGEEALKFGPEELLRRAGEAYDRWREEHISGREEEKIDERTASPTVSYDDIEQRAIEGIQQHINLKNAYEFQDLAAALLRGMGYYTPFVAPRGKDGGVDIVAYRDPLGTESPRIQVQIKHRGSAASVQEVRQLMGLLQKDGDVGVFISTGGFTPDARNAARSSHVHVELVDLDRFIGLWLQFYDRLKDEDKSLLPLRPIYFLAQPE